MSNVMEWRTRSDETATLWGAGEWQNEPDKIQWVDDETGLDCLMHRHPDSGHWCGYVGVSKGHPLFGIEYGACPLQECEDSWCAHSAISTLEVHGGITYSDFCQETDDESKGICHVPLEGRPHKVWWIGFDCAHSGDMSSLGYRNDPRWDSAYRRSEVYRSRRYVESEIASLAKQLASVSTDSTRARAAVDGTQK